jgi:osmoprotectant transport system permease protein
MNSNRSMIAASLGLFFISCLAATAMAAETIKVGSKIFTESYVLAEILAQTIEDAGEVRVERKFGLGATGIAFESLKNGEIDIYPEYTGTISEVFFKKADEQKADLLDEKLKPYGLKTDIQFGFNDTYALAVKRSFAESRGIKKISDLVQHPEIRAGFTHEFLKRNDGFEGLSRKYGLSLQNSVGMEHSLLYQSLEEDKIDLVEIYSTDAKVKKYDLYVLQDDLNYFPKYQAVMFYRGDLSVRFPKTMVALKKIENKISEAQMISLNAKVEIEHQSFAQAASTFFDRKSASENFSWSLLGQRATEHIFLVFLSLIAAILIGLPVGYWSAQHQILGPTLIAVIGLLQTIPSLALLCFFVPIFGIGYLPSVIALFLYAVLPIVQNTYLGFQQIDSRLIESGQTLALNRWQLLTRVQLPLASPAIMAGINISAVINVGTATLAAFVGAGGFGALIVTGLVLNDTRLILQGAIPSALLALAVHGLFELLSLIIVPKGLRK